MAQGQLPKIRGINWTPKSELEFINSLPADAAKSELLRFTAERHDGHLQLVAAVWDFVHRDEKSYDGSSWHEFSNRFVDALRQGLSGRLKVKGLTDGEIIPMRDSNLHLTRRADRFIIDIALCLRRLALQARLQRLEQPPKPPKPHGAGIWLGLGLGLRRGPQSFFRVAELLTEHLCFISV